MNFSYHKKGQMTRLFGGDLIGLNQLLHITKDMFNATKDEIRGRKYFNDILRNAHDYSETRNRFYNTINRIWNSKFTSELLDKDPDTLRYKIISAFNQFAYRPTGYTLNISLEAFRSIIEDPVIKAMLDEGLLMNLSYESAIRFRNATDFFHAMDYVAEQRAKMTIAQKIDFRIWQFRKGLYFNRQERKIQANTRDKLVLEPKRDTDLELTVLWEEPDFKENMARGDQDTFRKYVVPYWRRWITTSTSDQSLDKK